MKIKWIMCVVGRKPSEEKLIVNPKHKVLLYIKNCVNEDNRKPYSSIYCGEIFLYESNFEIHSKKHEIHGFCSCAFAQLFLIMCF